MPGFPEADVIAHNIGWIVSIFGLGVVLSGLLVALGVLKNKIQTAAATAERFKRELYSPDGMTNYVPRSELMPRLDALEDRIKAFKVDMSEVCSVNRAECHAAIMDRMNKMQRCISNLEAKYHDQSLGFVALSTQLSMLMKAAGIEAPHEVIDIQERLIGKAERRLRRKEDVDLFYGLNGVEKKTKKTRKVR